MTDKHPSWDDTFIELATVVAKRSKDPSTKVGAVIIGSAHEVRSTGYNGMPRGINDDIPERYERPLKYKLFEHAERNAIYNAARVGIPLELCSIYVDMYPCTDCARAIIQSGIIEVIALRFGIPERWWDDISVSSLLLEEAGILVRMPNERALQRPWSDMS